MAQSKKLKYIFVVGGVMSGVGKGIATASIGRILQSRGFAVTAVKIDPYVNVDAGTMNPTEHGEVFVLDDGMECDQDMGNYERFLDTNLTKTNYMTTGSVYLEVINRERNLEYHGKCVEVVPHIPLSIIDHINKAATKNKADVIMIEVGGTVGEYQNVLFLEAIRMLKLKKPGDVLTALVSYLPFQGKDSELKTKPTQYAVRTLNATGIQPDIIIARATVPIDDKRKEKIAFNCNVQHDSVISAPDIESIYDVPVNFEKDKISDTILKKLGLRAKKRDLTAWQTFVDQVHNATKPVKIGIVGKYFSTGSFMLADSYISVIEAVKHACYGLKRKPVIEWLNAEEFDPALNPDCEKSLKKLKDYDGVVIPGGFGDRGVEGKINAIRYCRIQKLPYLGLCYGMQLAVVEFARSVLGLTKANTTEVDPKTIDPVIDIMPEQKQNLAKKDFGATMRLGAYPAVIAKGTIAATAYHRHGRGLAEGDGKSGEISERHRHRYEVNPVYIEQLTKAGLVFSGKSPNGTLMEIAELPKDQHPFFVGSQFHPEFKSRPLSPHPLFLEFIKASIQQQKEK